MATSYAKITRAFQEFVNNFLPEGFKLGLDTNVLNTSPSEIQKKTNEKLNWAASFQNALIVAFNRHFQLQELLNKLKEVLGIEKAKSNSQPINFQGDAPKFKRADSTNALTEAKALIAGYLSDLGQTVQQIKNQVATVLQQAASQQAAVVAPVPVNDVVVEQPAAVRNIPSPAPGAQLPKDVEEPILPRDNFAERQLEHQMNNMLSLVRRFTGTFIMLSEKLAEVAPSMSHIEREGNFNNAKKLMNKLHYAFKPMSECPQLISMADRLLNELAQKQSSFQR